MKELSKIQINRRARLQKLIDEYGSKVNLANALGFASQSRVSHLTGTKGMGEKAARDIETRLKLPIGSMDEPLTDGDARSPYQPDSALLAKVMLVMKSNPSCAKLGRKKYLNILMRIYLEAEKTGVIDESELTDLMALTE